MKDYSNQATTSDKHGNKRDTDNVQEFNKAIEVQSGVAEKGFNSNFKQASDTINYLKLKSYNGGDLGSLSNISKPPVNTNNKNADFVATKMKDAYYQAVVDNDPARQKKLLNMPDKIVGALSIFKDANSVLSEALIKPLGSPGSINVGLMAENKQWLDYISDFNVNQDANFNLELDENDELLIYKENSEPIYVERLIQQQLDPSINSDQLIPLLGDPKELVYNSMDSIGDVPLVEQITADLNLQPVKSDKEDVMYTIEDNQKIEEVISNYDHTNILNQKSSMQSLWPQAQQMSVSALNGLDYENPDSWSPLENKLVSIFSEYRKYFPNVDLVKDYQENGGEQWGSYMGAEVNYTQKNSPLVDFQRDLLGWSFNNGYHNQSVLPYVKQESAIKQGDSDEGVENAGEEVKSSNNLFDETVEKVNIV